MKIETSIVDGIALLTIDNPPVNALSHRIRLETCELVRQLESNSTAKAIVITGAGKTFSAGADIREFGKPIKDPSLRKMIDDLESSSKPVIASIHGMALGGGLELTLGCQFRVALSTARMGLPEVNLGLIPGAGGTQRLPRLIGMLKAGEIITSGKSISAGEALEIGIIDSITTLDDPVEAGIEFARKIISESVPAVKTSDRRENLVKGEDLAKLTDRLIENAGKSRRGEIAPVRAVEALKCAASQSFVEGMASERKIFVDLLGSDQSQGMIHAFGAERQVAKIPELERTKPQTINSVGIIGGGTMGSGIAAAHLLSGLPVTMVEKDEKSLEIGKQNVANILEESVKRGKISTGERAKIFENLYTPTVRFESVSSVDLVIEAVFEDLDLKCEVFRILDQICDEKTILATNTSYLDVNKFAQKTTRASKVLGLHFFSPAQVMKLVEVVHADKTSSETVATGFGLARKLGKVAVKSGVCEGFIGNRIMSAFRKCAEYMVLDGASPYEVDEAVYEFGFPMGPFSMMDLAGLDIGWSNRKRLAPTRVDRERYPEFSDRICENGWFGRKTGMGFYIYDKSLSTGRPNPEVEKIISDERTKVGITPRKFSSEEIIKRYMAAMINESAKVLSDGIAAKPADVDVTLLYGYGFPRWRGGPLNYADRVGLEKILADIEKFQQEDEYFWQCSQLIKELIYSNRNFGSLNKVNG